MPPLVSFCVPTYNGRRYLPELIDSLLPQLDENAEIILCDDCSSDDTHAYSRELSQKHPFIKSFQNSANLGMDRNFHQAVKHASGKYVWLSGQDDIFGPEAYRTFLDVLRKHPDTDMMYFNYRQLFDGPPKYYGITYLKIEEDVFCRNSEEYFAVLDHAPSFLPATVMRRSYWEQTELQAYYGTIFVQVACWLINCREAKVYIVADPRHVDCRRPLDSWKFHDGKMWFDTKSGTLEVYHQVIHIFNTFPLHAYEKLRASFLSELPFDCVMYKSKGMVMEEMQKRRLRTIFGASQLLYYGYVVPLTRMPVWLAKILKKLHSHKFPRTVIRTVRRTLLPFKS